MTAPDFYTLDLTTLVIILLIALTVFMLLNYIDKEKDDNFTLIICQYRYQNSIRKKLKRDD